MRVVAGLGKISLGQQIALMSIVVAREQIGRGEEDENNGGRWVRMYRRGVDDGEPWCAALVSYDFEEAARRIAVRLPFPSPGEQPRLLGVRLPFVRTHGAKRLTDRIAAAGMWVIEPRERERSRVQRRTLELSPLQTGDVLCKHRGTGRQGHVQHVEEYRENAGTVTVIEGNAGKYPALVRREVLPYDVWTSGLYGVARLV